MYQLKKALYGPKQTSHTWYSEIDNYFIKSGFEKCKSELTLYVKHQDIYILIITYYFDDLIFTRSNKKMIKEFKQVMTQKLGLLHHFLVMEIYQVK